MTNPNPNGDEAHPQLIGNFHKTLPHNEYGEVDWGAYMHFRDLALAIEAGARMDFESVGRGVVPPGGAFVSGADATTARFTSPLAGASSETLGPSPRALEMLPAPSVLSASTAAEMVELYWMALLRDEPLQVFHAAGPSGGPGGGTAAALAELQSAFQVALEQDKSEGALQLGLDLPATNAGALDLRLQTLFRSGLKDEEYGPLVSQFFLRDIPYGTQTIQTAQFPYANGRNYLISYDDWLRAQNTGKDQYGRDYGTCNFYADDSGYYETQMRRVSTMRDLARFVNRDALHQAYFNAALFLDAVGAPLDTGNPYRRGGRYARQGGFATLGGPDLLTLVSEVASRALKVVWRQKWLVHRRARPEAYGGLVHMQLQGAPNGVQRAYGLPALVTNSTARQQVHAMNAAQSMTGTSFLPIAFSAGSPSHPAYGAGHATVAGACVTVLKAWFDESMFFRDLLDEANMPAAQKEQAFGPHQVMDPGGKTQYAGNDIGKMTVGGELNKVASNVAMGRSMGGVHWRSDNTRSLRLGEEIAIEILRKRTAEYAEKAVSFTFTSFDRKTVRIVAGQVQVG